MGREYQISFPFSKLSDFEGLMGRVGGHASTYGDHRFEFGLPTSPYATVHIDDKGIYFCDHHSDSEKAARIFLIIIDEALSFSDSTYTISVTGL